MAVEVKITKGIFKGGTRTLLNPSEKGRKYASELRSNIKKTNRMQPVTDKNGVVKDLTPTERAFRAGYLTSRSDNAKAYKYKKKKAAAKRRK